MDPTRPRDPCGPDRIGTVDRRPPAAQRRPSPGESRPRVAIPVAPRPALRTGEGPRVRPADPPTTGVSLPAESSPPGGCLFFRLARGVLLGAPPEQQPRSSLVRPSGSRIRLPVDPRTDGPRRPRAWVGRPVRVQHDRLRSEPHVEFVRRLHSGVRRVAGVALLGHVELGHGGGRATDQWVGGARGGRNILDGECGPVQRYGSSVRGQHLELLLPLRLRAPFDLGRRGFDRELPHVDPAVLPAVGSLLPGVVSALADSVQHDRDTLRRTRDLLQLQCDLTARYPQRVVRPGHILRPLFDERPGAFRGQRVQLHPVRSAL